MLFRSPLATTIQNRKKPIAPKWCIGFQPAGKKPSKIASMRKKARASAVWGARGPSPKRPTLPPPGCVAGADAVRTDMAMGSARRRQPASTNPLAEHVGEASDETREHADEADDDAVIGLVGVAQGIVIGAEQLEAVQEAR